MFVELIELLRCPRAHEESQLVVSAARTEARHILDGTLGCPVCGAEFPIRDGVAQFDPPPRLTGFEIPDAETAMRLAAQLDLTDARGFAILCGRWAVHADLVRRVAETPLVLMNHSIAAPVLAAAAAIRGPVVPFAAASARALAIDETSTRDVVASGVRAVRTGGRVVGPEKIPLPAGVIEMARDDKVWVGEKTAAPDTEPRLVTINRR